MCSPSRHFRSASTASFRAYDRPATRPHHDHRTEGVVPQERAREGLTYGRPRGATRVTGSGARSWSAEAPLPCYFPRDVFFCFFTFKLTIGAFAPVPRETGLDTGCFFDFPAMAILLGRGEWHGRSHRTGRGRMRCLCDGLGLSPKRWRVSAKCHSYRLGCESLNGRSWLLADGHQGHRLCDRSHKCGMLCKRPVERCSRRGLSTPLQLFPLARAQRGSSFEISA